MEKVIIKKPRSSKKKGRKKSFGEELMDVEQVATMLKISKSHVYHLTSKELIPHLKVFGKLLFNYEDIIGWIKTKKVSPKK